MGLAVWTQDEAGPCPTRPMPGQSWAEQGHRRQPHEYVRNGTAKLLTLFCPNSGELRARGVTTGPNAVRHPWLQQELTAVLDQLPSAAPVTDTARNPGAWEAWQQGLKNRITLPALLPQLRLLLVWDNLQGHVTPALVLWLFSHGVMPLYTPLGGSWLNMAESRQAHHQPPGPGRTVSADTATHHRRAGVNRQRLEPGPDAFSLGRQAPCAPSALQKSLSSCQVTH